MRLGLQNQKCHMGRGISCERERKKDLPLQTQWIVNSEPTQFQNQAVPKLSFEILSCSIAHEMPGPEEVRSIPRNHWHETAIPSLQCLLPLRRLVLEAWQLGRGRSGPSSQQPVTQPSDATATCRMSLQTELVRSSCLGKGTEAKAGLLSYTAKTGADLKLIFSSSKQSSLSDFL